MIGARSRQLGEAIAEGTSLGRAVACTGNGVPALPQRLAGNAGIGIGIKHRLASASRRLLPAIHRRQHNCGHDQPNKKMFCRPLVFSDGKIRGEVRRSKSSLASPFQFANLPSHSSI